MSAREVTAVAGAARALLEAHGAASEDAEMYAEKLTDAGLLIDPVRAEELLEDCRAQAAAEVRAELDELRAQVEAAEHIAGQSGDARSEWTLGYRACRNDLRDALAAARRGVAANGGGRRG